MNDANYNTHELRGALRSLKYSKAMLDRLCETLDTGELPVHVGNAALESALLHYRRIRAFLVGNPQQDDVSATDFVLDWKRGSKGSLPTELHDALHVDKIRIDKTLAHITKSSWSMHKNGDKSFDLRTMASNATQALEVFREYLPDAWKDWFDGEIKASFNGESGNWVFNL